IKGCVSKVCSLALSLTQLWCIKPISKHKMCNRALIVSVTGFYPEAGLEKRNGAYRDVRRLHRVLSKLGFSVKILNDLEADEIYEAFKTESEKAVDSCFVGVISSHGEEGVIFGADGHPVRLGHLYSYFGGLEMAGKKKMFLIQACRGNELDDGVKIESDGLSEVSSVSECLSVPLDSVVVYATPPGYSAFMNLAGSVFIQTFCELLEDGGAELEVTRLLTRLNHHIAHHFQARGQTLGGKKEMPCFVSRLTTDFFLSTDSRKKQEFNFTDISEPRKLLGSL
uniref:Caspase 3, apoptosis-related cysteine peptidase-like n=1 Tax=Electrophorus electricus TaxID=8005 RepID=A0A4W4H7V2_ELEEL